MPWGRLLGYRAVWAYLIASILAGPAWGFYQFFLPDFLSKSFGLPLTETGLWTGIFFAVATAGGVVGGWLPGWLMARGWNVRAARQGSLLVCALAVTPLYLAVWAPTVWLAVLIVGVAGSAHQGWSANLFSMVSDTMPKQAVGTVVGLGGFVSYFTAGVVSWVTGQLLQATGSYTSIFAYFSGTYLLSLLAVYLLVPRQSSPSAA